jgi:hypothetical protein
MSLTFEEVLAVLHADELDYASASLMGPDALLHLGQIVRGTNPQLAAKAAYLSGMIGGLDAGPILMDAAASNDPTIRAAAAGAAAHLRSSISVPVLSRLLDDTHPDIRRLALQSLPAEMTPTLRATVERIARIDSDPSIRKLSEAALQRAIR